MTEELSKINPTRAIETFRECNTPGRCLKGGFPALAKMRKEQGESRTRKMVEMWISDLNDFLNISRKMSPQQIRQTASMIIQEYYYYNLADINLVFTRAKKGRYGNLFESLDGMKIFSWFDQYDHERAEAAYSEALREHDRLKSINKETQ